MNTRIISVLLIFSGTATLTARGSGEARTEAARVGTVNENPTLPPTVEMSPETPLPTKEMLTPTPTLQTGSEAAHLAGRRSPMGRRWRQA